MGDWVTAVVPAAGRGVRMGTNVPKQFLTLGGIPLLVHSLRVLDATPLISEIILVVPPDDCQHCQEDIIPSHGLKKISTVVAGGPRRQDSVWNGLLASHSEAQMVVVHDAVRPFVTNRMITEVVSAAQTHGAAIVAIPMRDTVKRVDGEPLMIKETLSRENLWLAQTPQAFKKELLLRAHQEGEAAKVEATDDAFLVERLGIPVAVVQGSTDNVKVTRPEDLLLGQAILSSKTS